MPQIGYGTWNRDEQQAYQGVLDALELGYRHIDTAQAYANENAVGKAIQDSAIQRGDIFITTKVDPVNYGPGEVAPSVERSLQELGCDRVDLLLLHFPSLYDKYPLQDYFAQLLQVKQQGLCDAIGVSNFTKAYLDACLPLLGDEQITCNQVELHAYMQNNAIVEHCKKLGIVITAYSPLARGALLDDPLLNDIASRHQASASQVALAFLMNQGYAVIPSSASKMRIQENLDAGKLQLSAEEIKQIKTLDRGMRLVDEDWCPRWD
ncbi:aldo/keto reductase [Agaribacterium haliotis]|uniref:aldo/keto reductase n=1 Tax=Agaribacterium haliotis TaxID=2013869 RepID=UPI000BB5547D|nr:aldo/keto reductase [Agaribacterium haliotis]